MESKYIMEPYTPDNLCKVENLQDYFTWYLLCALRVQIIIFPSTTQAFQHKS